MDERVRFRPGYMLCPVERQQQKQEILRFCVLNVLTAADVANSEMDKFSLQWVTIVTLLTSKISCNLQFPFSVCFRLFVDSVL